MFLPALTEEIEVTCFTLTIDRFQNATSSATACLIPSHIGDVISHIVYRVLSRSVTKLLVLHTILTCNPLVSKQNLYDCSTLKIIITYFINVTISSYYTGLPVRSKSFSHPTLDPFLRFFSLLSQNILFS